MSDPTRPLAPIIEDHKPDRPVDRVDAERLHASHEHARAVLVERFHAMVRWRGSALLVVIAAMVVFFSSQSPLFLTANNAVNIAQQAVIYGLLAVGLTMVVLTGGIDLSFPSVLAMAGLTAGYVNVVAGQTASVAILCGIGVGLVAGLVNGALVAYTHLQPFVITLGTYSICVSLALMIGDGSPIQGFSADFSAFPTNKIGSIPSSVFVLVAVSLLAWLLLRSTRLGRFIYASGGNEKAARLAGIRVSRVQLAVYALSGLLAGLAGVVQSGTLGVAAPQPSFSLLLIAIASVVVGGASLTGGVGSVGGTLTGVVLLTILSNGLNVMAVAPFYQDLLLGIAVIGSVLINDFARGRSRRG